MKVYLIVCITFILAGCATLRQEQISVVVNSCPAIVNYTPEEQKIAAQELQKLFTNSQLAVMINDYAKLRAACRIVAKKVKAYRAVKKRSKK